VLWHLRSKPGRAWAAIRQSEPAALTAGVNVTVYKMWAFALASFITGVAGGLLGSSSGKLYTYQFPTQASIFIFAVVLMGGIYTVWGAVLGSALLWVLPALFKHLGHQRADPRDPLRPRCAAGADDGASRHRAPVPARHGEARQACCSAWSGGSRDGGSSVVIEVKDLTVHFGGVIPLGRPDGQLRQRHVRSDRRPNGAGKTTFFNVLSGFVKPSAGSVRAFGDDLLAIPHFRRAPLGLRRTFQMEQAIEELSIYDNVAMVHEHSSRGRASRRADVLGAIDFVRHRA